MTARRSTRTAAVATALLVLALPACRSGDTTDGAAAAAAPTSEQPTPEPVDPVVISTDPPLDSVDVAPVTPLHVNAGHGTLTAVTVTDEDGVVLPGGLDPQGLTWTASADLAYGTTYSVAATAVDAGGTSSETTGTIATVRPRTLTMPSVFPSAGSTVGVGQPISVTFDEDVTDRAAVERQLRVTTTPPVAGSWSWQSDRSVHFRPEHYWPAHTHVAVDADVYGLDVGNGIHGQASQHVEFDVGAKKVGVVDATEHVLRLYVDDQLVKEMPTSLGNAANQTPTGTYVVMAQSRVYTMDSSTFGVAIDAPGGYKTPVEYASRLSNSGIFVHAAPWSVGDQGRRNVSHGCLNVSTANAGWFYDNFGRGDVVEVAHAGPALQVWDGYGDWNEDWASWQAGSALVRPAT